jgi:DNA polymerase kappa
MESSGAEPGNDPKPQSANEDFGSLKYQLLGPSLTKAGQDSVDQQKVRLVIQSFELYRESMAEHHL